MEKSPITRRSKTDLPFYETPEHVRTSARIVNEARSNLRTLPTQRPFTPKEEGRTLFGHSSSRDPSNRPPSAFSLGSRHFDGCDSRPVSGTRLTPLEYEAKSPPEPEAPRVPRPPADPNRPVVRKSSRKKLVLNQQQSIDGSTDIPRSGSLTDIAGNVQAGVENSRRVHSGPKERTSSLLEEREEPEGREAEPRVASRSDHKHSKERRVESGYHSDARGDSAARVNSSKSGSGSRREEETPEEALFFNTNITPILDDMYAHRKGIDKDPGRLMELSRELYQLLEENKMLGKKCKRRTVILKTIFKLLDSEEPSLLLQMARLIFALKVTGNNLNNVCKLVYKVSKDDKNDPLFIRKDNLLDLLIDATRDCDPTTSVDALVYCVGAIKFLSGNSTILKELTRKGCIKALARLLANTNKAASKGGKPVDQYGHALVQLTASLRNLLDTSASRAKFIEHGVVKELSDVMSIYPTDPDLMMNVSRIFSKLTMHTDCCNSLLDLPGGHIKSFLYLLNKHLPKQDMVVRISFILGNLTAKSEEARKALFQQRRGMETLLLVLKTYCEKDTQECAELEKAAGEQCKNPATEDVLIKVIRVIANLSINEEIGSAIASNSLCVDLLLQVLVKKDISKSEELVLNTMVTINNLSYYAVKTSAIAEKQCQISECLLELMLTDHIEGMVEAGRIYGNLSRHRSVRDFLMQNKVGEMMVALLDSGAREVVYSACGVLINLMADEGNRSMLKKEGGIRKLVDVMRDFGRSDWQLASMVCQTLWNYSGKITSSNATYGEEESQELQDVLVDYLDEETALDAGLQQDYDEEMKDWMRESWETEFCPVATQLLHRLESHQSAFESLDTPS